MRGFGKSSRQARICEKISSVGATEIFGNSQVCCNTCIACEFDIGQLGGVEVGWKIERISAQIRTYILECKCYTNNSEVRKGAIKKEVKVVEVHKTKSDEHKNQIVNKKIAELICELGSAATCKIVLKNT